MGSRSLTSSMTNISASFVADPSHTPGVSHKQKHKMKEYKFKKNWMPKLKLEVLTKLGSKEMFSPNGYQRWIRDLYEDHKANKVQIRIEDAKNENDIPEKSQLNAINYILNNEQNIYQEIYKTLTEIIYPYYSDLLEEDIQEYAPLNKIKDMPKVLGLVQIQVNLMSENEMAWSTYMFEWKGEEEHGLSILFEGAKYLKHDGAGDMWYDGVIPENELESLRKEWGKQMPKKLYYPNAKLRSYKPWQLEQTKNYLLDLLKENRFEEFKTIVSEDLFDKNQKFPEDGFPILEHVVKGGFIDAGKLLFDLGANTTGIMHFGNPYYENSNRIYFMNIVGGNLDQLNDFQETLVTKYLNIASRELKFKNFKKIELYERHIKLLLSYGAKLNKEEEHLEVINHMGLIN